MARASTEEILKTLKTRIERANKHLDGLDPKGDGKAYRTAHKRLKRAQRRLKTWQDLAALLEKRRLAGEKKKAKSGTPDEPAAEKTAKKDDKKADKKEDPASESKADAPAGESAAG